MGLLPCRSSTRRQCIEHTPIGRNREPHVFAVDELNCDGAIITGHVSCA
jgi:hypothetical protein